MRAVSTAFTLSIPGATFGFSANDIELIKQNAAKGVSDDELRFFLAVCQATGLNPLLRQIHAVARKSKNSDGSYSNHMTIQTGIDGYRTIAHRSKRFAGEDDAIFDTETATHPNKATVTVYRIVAGQRCPFTATARWSEYVQKYTDKSGNEHYMGMWATMPYGQLAKCAAALALRKAFQEDMRSTYTDEEMQQADNHLPENVVESRPAIAAPEVVVTEEPAPKARVAPSNINPKEIEAQEWKKLDERRRKLGLSDEDYAKGRKAYDTVAKMAAALNRVEENQRKDAEEAADESGENPDAVILGNEVEPEQEVGEEAAPNNELEAEAKAWDQLHGRFSNAGGTIAQWEQLLAESKGDITEALEFVKNMEQHSLKTARQFAGSKGRN